MPYPIIPMNGLFDAEYFDIRSSHVNDTFRIFVGKPSTIQPGELYPVIYTLDGNASFTSVMGTQRLLTQGGEVPASFVVGIGYPGDTLWSAMANRNRDYAPTDPGEMEARALGISAQAGGAAFLRFIQKELKPALEEKYPIDGSGGTLQGVSLGDRD
jgi:predicted alpha/beta superfamily hydrolase